MAHLASGSESPGTPLEHRMSIHCGGSSVLGVGRSGTSAITRVLSLCGASLPERLLGAGEGIPQATGSLSTRSISTKRFSSVMAPIGTTLDGPAGRPWSIGLKGRRSSTNSRCSSNGTSTNRCSSSRSRGSRRLRTEFWFAAARRAGYEIAAVVAVRHPAEVAASLAARDGVPIELCRHPVAQVRPAGGAAFS